MSKNLTAHPSLAAEIARTSHELVRAERYKRKKTQTEIATIMGMTPGALAFRKQRAYRYLGLSIFIHITLVLRRRPHDLLRRVENTSVSLPSTTTTDRRVVFETAVAALWSLRVARILENKPAIDIARTVGISYPHLYNIETAERIPEELELFIHECVALGVPPSDILRDAEDQVSRWSPPVADRSVTVVPFRALTAEQKRSLVPSIGHHYAQGATAHEIAEWLGTSNTTIIDVLIKNSIQLHRSGTQTDRENSSYDFGSPPRITPTPVANWPVSIPVSGT